MTSTAIASELGSRIPSPVNGHIWKPFATYEAFYERSNGGWNRDRVMAGVTLPLAKHVSFQPSYIWENNRVRGLTGHQLPAVWTDCQHEIGPVHRQLP